jgi:hypothetical protein
VRFVKTPGGVVIANRIAQQGIQTRQGVSPTRYATLEICLDLVGAYAARERLDIHMPRIGTGLAGGSWAHIEQLLGAMLCERYGRQVTVYDFP